jgi:hypothetical protein
MFDEEKKRRSQIQLPASSKLFSTPLFAPFGHDISLSALQASPDLHRRYFSRPEQIDQGRERERKNVR